MNCATILVLLLSIPFAAFSFNTDKDIQLIYRDRLRLILRGTIIKSCYNIFMCYKIQKFPITIQCHRHKTEELYKHHDHNLFHSSHRLGLGMD